MEDRGQNLLGAFVLEVAGRIRHETEEAIGHSGATAAALVTIAQFPGRTVEELRRAIGLSHPAAVRVVDRLAGAGLVERTPAGRGPAVALTATAAGRRKARQILDIRQKILAEALPALSGEEERVLTGVLQRALAHLADSPDPVICRLCDTGRCRRADCPVMERQAARGNPPPEFVPLDG
jgi:MarR family transcriptional regulator, negative regulator of the multidrug operon emrRAB